MINFIKRLLSFFAIFTFFVQGLELLAAEKTTSQKNFEQAERSAENTVKLIEVKDHIKQLLSNMKSETEDRISNEKQRFFSLPDLEEAKIKEVEKLVNTGLAQLNKLISKGNSALNQLLENPGQLAEKVNGLDLESINLVKEKINFDALAKNVATLEKSIFEKIKKVETSAANPSFRPNS